MIDKNILNDEEYMSIVQDYLNDNYVQLLKNIPHHDSNRLEHSVKVSYLAYKIAKKRNLNYKSVAKAGLLHDFYFNRIEDLKYAKDKVKMFMNDHPVDAANNAEEHFGITELERDIIVSHMWPTSFHIPHYKESFVVSCADKVYSFKDFFRKWNYNLSFMTGAYFIFVIYSIFK